MKSFNMTFSFNSINYFSRLKMTTKAGVRIMEVFDMKPLHKSLKSKILFSVANCGLISPLDYSLFATFYDKLAITVLAKCQEHQIPIFK